MLSRFTPLCRLALCMLPAALILLSSVGPAIAADHFPLTDGLVRTYRYYHQQGNGLYTTRMDGVTVIGSDTVQVYRYVDGPYRNRVEYWSENSEHDKFLHGYDITGYGGYSYRFAPPILQIDEPLFVGKTWTSISVVNGEETAYLGFEVTGEYETVTGVGTFQAFSIYGAGVSIDNKIATPAEYVRDRRFADGMGMVYFWDQYNNRYEFLKSFGPTPVNAVTWGRLKSLYR